MLKQFKNTKVSTKDNVAHFLTSNSNTISPDSETQNMGFL